MQIKWLNQALSDFNEQIDYIAERNPNAAIEQATFIEENISNLKDFPEMGRKGRINGTRELVISGTPFIVVYVVQKKAKLVEIVRILHGSQQWPH